MLFKHEWRLLLILVVQLGFVFITQHYFNSELGEVREQVVNSLSGHGMPPQQVAAMSSLVVLIKGHVSWFVIGVSSMIILTDAIVFSMILSRKYDLKASE